MKTAIKILAAVALMLPLFACAHVSPNAVAIATGDVGGRMGAMLDDVKAARPHADQYGQGLLDSAATTGAQIQAKDLPVLTKAAGQLAADEAEIKKLDNQWISPRMWGMIWIIGGSLLGIWIVAGVLEEVGAGSIFLTAVSGFLKAMGTIGGSIVGAVSKWLTGKIVKASAAITTLHTVAQSTKAAQSGITIAGQPVIGIPVSVPSAGPGTKGQPIATA